MATAMRWKRRINSTTADMYVIDVCPQRFGVFILRESNDGSRIEEIEIGITETLPYMNCILAASSILAPRTYQVLLMIDMRYKRENCENRYVIQ